MSPANNDKDKAPDVDMTNQDPTNPAVPSTNPTTAGDATPEDVKAPEAPKAGAYVKAKNGTITRVPSKG